MYLRLERRVVDERFPSILAPGGEALKKVGILPASGVCAIGGGVVLRAVRATAPSLRETAKFPPRMVVLASRK